MTALLHVEGSKKSPRRYNHAPSREHRSTARAQRKSSPVHRKAAALRNQRQRQQQADWSKIQRGLGG